MPEETKVEEPKSYVRTVTAGKERLQFVAAVAKLDVSFYVLQQEETTTEKDGKQVSSWKTVSRGGSQKFTTLAEASKAVDKGVEEAVKAGWTLPAKVGGGGFKAKADNFSLSNLPKPKAAATKAPAAPIPNKK